MEDGLVPQETVEGLIKQKFEAPMPRYKSSVVERNVENCNK